MVSPSRLDEKLDTIVTPLVRNTEDEEPMTKRCYRTRLHSSMQRAFLDRRMHMQVSPGISDGAVYLLTAP